MKKELVDQNRLEVSQEQLEESLFAILQTYHYGQETIKVYRMMSRYSGRR